MIGVKFARAFESMAEQIENDEPAAFLQNAMRGGDGAFGMNGVMQAWLKIARSTVPFSIGGSSMSPSRYSRFLKPCSCASFAPNSTIFGELSIAMTFFAVFARSCDKRSFAGAEIGHGLRGQQA